MELKYTPTIRITFRKFKKIIDYIIPIYRKNLPSKRKKWKWSDSFNEAKITCISQEQVKNRK